jgi:hypothetical protein
MARPVIPLTAKWLSVAARSTTGVKIPAAKAMTTKSLGNLGGFRSCRAAVIVLGDDSMIRDKSFVAILARSA